jgi:hypothetical protein
VRLGGAVTPQADVYSLGAILIELMTGRRPSLDTPSAELRAGDPRSDELGGFLRRCLAEPEERFASATEAHRALQQMVTGNPFSLFTANLALFLYKLLNPESQSVAPSSDWESTSPVVLETKTRRGESTAIAFVSSAEPPRRRRGDLEQVEEAAIEPAPAVVPPAPSVVRGEPDYAPAPIPIQEHAAVLLEAIARPLLPLPLEMTAAVDEAVVAPAHSPIAWRGPALALAAAAGLTAGVFFLADQLGSRSHKAAARAAQSASVPENPAPVADPPAAAPAQPAAIDASGPGGRVEAAAHRAAAPARPPRKIHPELKQPAEDLRYKAALARIEADRFDARQKAPEIFGDGVQSEREGARLLQERDYDAAQMAYSRAAQLFAKAQEFSFQERVRGTSLSANP